MRSVLYAPDMWVSLGHSNGQVFVTMPRDPTRVDTDWQQAARGDGDRRRRPAHARRRWSAPPAARRGPDDGAASVVAARAAPRRAAGDRRQPLGRRRLPAVAPAGARVLGSSSSCSRRRPASACTAASGGAAPSSGCEAEASRERRKSAEQLELALQGADLGLWDWDLREDRFMHNELMLAQLGYGQGDIGKLGSDLARPGPPETTSAGCSRPSRRTSAARRRSTNASSGSATSAGHWVWLLSRGKIVERDEFGIAVRMAGTHMDLTPAQADRAADGALGGDAAPHRRARAHRRLGARPGDAARRLDRAGLPASTSSIRARCRSLDNALDFYAPEAQPLIRDAIDAAASRTARPGISSCRSSPRAATTRWVRAQGVAAMRGRASRCACSAPSRTSPRRRRSTSSCTA